MEKIMLFSGATIEETFDDFMLSRKTKGLSKLALLCKDKDIFFNTD